MSYESALQTLLANELIVLLEAKAYEPQVKTKWWNNKHICAYHQNRGHLTNNCFTLKGSIQKLINNGTIKVNNLINNKDHTAFKNPFMNHEKGKSSRASQKELPQNKFNYAHYYVNTINMISEFDDVVNVIIVKDKNKKKSSNVVT